MSEPARPLTNVLDFPWGAPHNTILRACRLFGWVPEDKRVKLPPLPTRVEDPIFVKRAGRGGRPRLRLVPPPPPPEEPTVEPPPASSRRPMTSASTLPPRPPRPPLRMSAAEAVAQTRAEREFTKAR